MIKLETGQATITFTGKRPNVRTRMKYEKVSCSSLDTYKEVKLALQTEEKKLDQKKSPQQIPSF